MNVYFPLLLSLASSLVARASQHVLAPDVCAFVSTNLYDLLEIPTGTIKGVPGDLDVCLCQSSVDGPRGFVATNQIAQLAGNDLELGVGEDKVIQTLMYYIASKGATCTYPNNAMPICSEDAPCDFNCGHGFTRVGDACVCPAPFSICAGHCQESACTNSLERALLEEAARRRATPTTPRRKRTRSKKAKRVPEPQVSKREPSPQSKRAPEPQPSKRSPLSKRAPEPQVSKRSPQSKRAPVPQPSKRSPQSKRAPEPQVSKRSPQSKRAPVPQPSKRTPAPVPQVSKRAPAPEPTAGAAEPAKRTAAPQVSKRAPEPLVSKRAPAPQPSKRSPQSKRAPSPQSKRAPSPQSKRAPTPQPSKRSPQSKRAPSPQSKRAPSPQSKRAPSPQSKRAPIPQPSKRLVEIEERDEDEAEGDNEMVPEAKVEPEYTDNDTEEDQEDDDDDDDDDESLEDDKTDFASLRERDYVLSLQEDRCRIGQTLCGGWKKGVDEWECLDTRSTLDSCGGCIYPYFLDENPPTGVDCSSLPGVVDVECRNSRCIVHSCKNGYVLSPAYDECILTN